jgi:hypothetical protein
MRQDEGLTKGRTTAWMLLRRRLPTMVFVMLRCGQMTAGQIAPIAKPGHRLCKSRAFPNRKDLPTLANRSSGRNRSRLLSGRPRPI